MILWAKLDEDDVVIDIVREKEASDRHEELAPGTSSSSLRVEEKEKMIRTMPPEEGPRGSYAAPGFRYDRELKGFVPPQLDPTDILDTKKFVWLPAKPDEVNDYFWDDSKQAWVQLDK